MLNFGELNSPLPQGALKMACLGKPKAEHATLIRFALGPYLAAVSLDDVLGDCKAKSGSFSGAGFIRLVESFEDVR